MNRPIVITAVGGIALVLTTALWHLSRPTDPVVAISRPPVVDPVPPSEDPFDRAIVALTRDRPAVETDSAIEYLDTTTRLGVPLPPERRAVLTSALEHGKPRGMPTGVWAHLFNSACNALATGGTAPDPALIHLLERLATTDSQHVIRLYALQHLGNRYADCNAATRDRIRAMVADILTERPVSPVAGTALVLARRWEAPGKSPHDSPVAETARLLAAEATLPVDVRVTALHTAGEDATVLDTARILAADPAQPAILRKAALYLIGRHGTAADLQVLERCSRESVRLAQAADPARKVLNARLDGTPAKEFVPISF